MENQSLLAKFSSALAGTYVLRFFVRSALMNGRMAKDCDKLDEMSDDLHCGLCEGAKVFVGLGGKFPGSMVEVIDLSPVDSKPVPESDGDLLGHLVNSYESLWQEWSAVAALAGETPLARWASERAACARDCAACLDDMLAAAARAAIPPVEGEEEGEAAEGDEAAEGEDGDDDDGDDPEAPGQMFAMELDEAAAALPFPGAAAPFKKGGGRVRDRHPMAAKEPKLKKRKKEEGAKK